MFTNNLSSHLTILLLNSLNFIMKFVLDNSFVQKYADIEPSFGYDGLGKFTYTRTYARKKPDGTLEQWFETVARCVNGIYTMQKNHVLNHNLGWDDAKGQASAQEMYDRIFNFKFLPPGRALWACGTDITEKRGLYSALCNCAFVSTADIATKFSRPFRFVMDQLMLGVGNGFDCEGAGKVIVQDPHDYEISQTKKRIKSHKTRQFTEALDSYSSLLKAEIAHLTEEMENTSNIWTKNSAEKFIKIYSDELKYVHEDHPFEVFVVPDDREGWVESTGKIIDSYLIPDRRPVLFDYSQIRPKGLPLKTFGGMSSGPIPLVDLHINIRRTFNRNLNKPITVTSIADVMNLIGKTVVSGNVRRCLPKGTSVHTTSGPVAIENITPEHTLVTWRGEQKVKQLFDQGEQSIYHITTDIGTLRCTENHRVAVMTQYNPSLNKYKYEFVRCAELDPDMKLVHSTHDMPGIPKVKKSFPSPVNIKSIQRDVETVHCYDIEVEISNDIKAKYDLTDDNCREFAINEGFIVHNSAEIALGKHDDKEFLNLKNYVENPERMDYGWASNNTVYGKLGMDYTDVADRIADNGEPGVLWLENAHKYGRMNGEENTTDTRTKGVNPCGEQILENYEMCVLVETFPHRAESLEDFKRTLKFAYLVGKTVTLGSSQWPETNRVQMRNRRIGCSVSGITQFLAVNNINVLKQWLNEGYEIVRKWDDIYSDWLCIPKSVRVTTIKPSGTLSLLAGATPGIHFPQARFYIRRVRLMKDSYLVPKLKAAGYKVEPCIGTEKTTVVVEFPTKLPEKVRTVDEVSVYEKVNLAQFMQENWSDNSVSVTVCFDKKTEGKEIKNILNYAQYNLKAISFLPRLDSTTAYPQMPYETITEEKYLEMSKDLKQLDFSEVTKKTADKESDMYCDGDKCIRK